MSRIDFDLLRSFCVHPSTKHTAAGEYERVLAMGVEDGEFEIAIKGRSYYGVPIHSKMVGHVCASVLDLAQFAFRPRASQAR